MLAASHSLSLNDTAEVKECYRESSINTSSTPDIPTLIEADVGSVRRLQGTSLGIVVLPTIDNVPIANAIIRPLQR